jgi:hypothetical protein
MTEKKEVLTKGDLEEIWQYSDKLGVILEGAPAFLVLHVLCRLMADVGTQNTDRLTKREFVANAVECLDYWYEAHLEAEDE